MNIRISVIIPVYNMEKFLQNCLDSVLEQTLKDIEIICVNDGSIDRSAQIILENISKDSRIILINKKNEGAASARNAALEAGSGEFVIFMDPDDWYPDNDILETLYLAAKEHHVFICGGSFSEVSDERGLVTEFGGIRAKYTFKDNGLVYYKDYQFDYGYHRFIYDRLFLKENDIIFPPYLRYQDPPFFVKAMIAAEKFYAVSKIVYRYRVGHKTVNWTERKLSDLLRGLRDNIKMSREANLSALHKITVERLGIAYKDLYASHIKDYSANFLHLLMEVDTCIDTDLLYQEMGGQYLIDAIPDIIKRAIELEREDLVESNRKLENMYKNSKSFKIGRMITFVPAKIKALFGR